MSEHSYKFKSATPTEIVVSILTTKAGNSFKEEHILRVKRETRHHTIAQFIKSAHYQAEKYIEERGELERALLLDEEYSLGESS